MLGKVVHTTSYGECETITYNWGTHVTCAKEEKDDNKEKPKQLLPHLCTNQQNRVGNINLNTTYGCTSKQMLYLCN